MPTYPGNPFLPFGSDDDSIVMSEELTSQPAGSTLLGSDTSAIDFNADGMMLATDYGGLLLASLTSAQIEALDIAGTFTFWVSKNICEKRSSIAYNEHLFMINGGNAVQLRKASPTTWFSASLPGGSTTTYGAVSELNKSDVVRIDLTWIGKYIYFIIDNHIHQRWEWTTKPSTIFTNPRIGGNGSWGQPPQDVRFLRVQLSTRPISIPVIPLTSDVVMLGHSFTNADYSSSATTGFYVGGGDQQNLNIGNEIHRKFNKLGFDIGGGAGMANYGDGGDITADLTGATGSSRDQIALMQAGGNQKPTLVFIVIGANDISGIAQTESDLDTRFTTNMQSAITELIALNADVRIVIANMPPVSNLDTDNNADAKAAWEGGNSRMEALESANSANVIVSKVDTIFGTHDNPDTSLFNGSNNLHPNPEGYSLIGQKMGQDTVNKWFV